MKQSSSSSSSTAHLAEDEAATEIETMKERVLFWRYKIQRAENAVNAVLGHKFETVVEDAFFRNINLKLQYDQLSITRDYASKLFAKKAIEPVCQGGPAGIATDHVYFIKYMWPKNASASAVTQGTYRYGEDENRGHMTVIEDERGGEGDGNETNTDSTLARKGIFIHVFSPDTQQVYFSAFLDFHSFLLGLFNNTEQRKGHMRRHCSFRTSWKVVPARQSSLSP